MGLTLRQIRENTAQARELMKRSRAEKFAVGAFKLDNQETLKAICRAALVTKSPVIVEVGPDEAESIGMENIRDMVDNYKEELAIEIYVNLDHSPSVETAIAGIEAGFEFIHIDVAKDNLDIDEIAAKTKLIVDYAKLTGALVEGELFYAGKSQNDLTSPADAKYFVDATGIDTFAVAIGNQHTQSHGPKILDLDLLKKIRKQLACNISLHGGSGIPEHYFTDAAAAGVNKISVDTDLKITFRSALETILRQNPEEIAVAKLMDEVISSVQNVVEEKIDTFGSTEKTKA